MKRAALGVFLIVVAVTAYIAAARPWEGASQTKAGAPILEYPARLDLGKHDIGDTVVARYSIANRGKAPLNIDSIRTSCSCAGIEQESNGKHTRIEQLRIEPGTEVPLVTRIAVRGVPTGGELVNSIVFRTDDPQNQSATMNMVVKVVSHGVFMSPTAINFGRVPAGAAVRHIVEVRAQAETLRRIERVVATPDDAVTVRYTPEPNPNMADARKNEGTVVGLLEISVTTKQLGPIDGSVSLYVEERPNRPDILRVMGEVVGPVSLTPSTLLLPRVTSSGKAYDAICTCRSNNGKPLSLTLEQTPEGLTVEVLELMNPTMKSLRVSWKPNSGGLGESGEMKLVRLRAVAGDEVALVELSVVIMR